MTCKTVTRSRVFNVLTKSFVNGHGLWITELARRVRVAGLPLDFKGSKGAQGIHA